MGAVSIRYLWVRRLVFCGVLAGATALTACGGGSGTTTPSLGGQVTGLGADKNLVLRLQAGDEVQEATLSADGRFSFSELPPAPFSYSLSVRSQPFGLTCVVANAQGVVKAGERFPDIAVTCAASTYQLSGTVTGNTGTVTLVNSVNGDTTNVSGDGTFSMMQRLPGGEAYAVSVTDSGAGQACTIANGSGTANADVSDIAVTCGSVPPPPAVLPAIPSGLAMTYDVKAIKLAWTPVTPSPDGSAITYRVFEDADGAGPAASMQIANGLSLPGYTHEFIGLLHTRINATYSVQACNGAGCSPLALPLTIDVSKAMGYFKASNAEADDGFGESVALSADGSTFAVSAYAEDSNATGVDGNQADNSVGLGGAVYVFKRNAGVWIQQAYLKPNAVPAAAPGFWFGRSIALSDDGNTLAVGAHYEDSNATGIDGDPANNLATNSGAVYVFSRSGDAWSHQAYVKASNTDANDQFGTRVALSADGNTLAVGAHNERSTATHVGGDESINSINGAGAVYVFARSAGTWTQQAYVKASNTQAQQAFGTSVALSGDGNTLAVGANNEASSNPGNPVDVAAPGSGAVYILTRSGGVWAHQAYLKAGVPTIDSYFGTAVALSNDGNTLAVGAYKEDSNATGIGGDQTNQLSNDSGAVYVFARAGGNWSHQAYVKPSNTADFSYFGSSVTLSGDGNTLVAGAEMENTGAASSGAFYVFNRSGSAWGETAFVKSGTVEIGDKFGTAVSLSRDGSALAVGTYAEDGGTQGINGNRADNSASMAGAAYLY